MGLVAPVEGPSAWRGQDLANSRRWICDLQSRHIGDLDAALAMVENRGIDWREITVTDFPLPGLTDLIGQIRNELENGCGLMKLRGLPVWRYNEDQLRTLYFGLGSNVGTPVYQNRHAELMRCIRDEGADVGKRYGQIEDARMEDGKPFLSSYARTLSNGALRFHTDRTDVVALLCVNQAAHGGVSTICSSVSVMNEMLRRSPDLAHLLFEPWYRSRHGEEAEVADDVYALPICGLREGRFTSHFSLTYIEAAQTVDGVPKLSDAQQEAIDLLLSIAQELAFEMVLEPGDIQFLNSHVTYHGRTPFADDKGTARERLLMRLWLAMPNSRPLPLDHQVLWRNVEAGAVRGGIGQVPAGRVY
ncbi:TauD/TfdA family dioxygenase [Gammaproteobacteria bacterium]|nr:TauD/TfdA family dioxygenase [Gammaproteobacteria bacterium]